MKRVDDFRLRLGNKEYVPIMIGGMGVDISTSELALEAARLGGIGHISDAMVPDVSDRKFDTSFVKEKTKLYKFNINNMDKSVVQFDLDRLAEATRLHVGATMAAKKGDGLIFVNCMEKLTMNAPKETLRTRLSAALDAGIDGITMSAGLHLGSFELIKDHPRFRDAKLGIIVSSVRALQLFLRKVSRLNRLPDYIIVEGPLAGGHLGFGIDDWQQYDLHTIMDEIHAFMRAEQLDIPLIAAGGIFTGSDAVGFLEKGAGGVQVATRFTSDPRVRPAGRRQAGILPRQRGRHHRQRRLADRLSDADAEADAGDRLGHPSRLRILRLPAGRDRQLRLHQFVQPRSAGQSGFEEHQGVRQDLLVHPHAQLQLLDLRLDHLPPEGHDPQAGGRQVPDPVGRARVQGLPVQRRQPGRAAAARRSRSLIF
jgi:NAD(P)H-dependent flavin oxidoreductase YrpB (nitropropane dioxygenase family)